MPLSAATVQALRTLAEKAKAARDAALAAKDAHYQNPSARPWSVVDDLESQWSNAEQELREEFDFDDLLALLDLAALSMERADMIELLQRGISRLEDLTDKIGTLDHASARYDLMREFDGLSVGLRTRTTAVELCEMLGLDHAPAPGRTEE